MTKNEKLIDNFLKNPEFTHFRKIEVILKNLNFEKASIKGSHCKFRHKELKTNLVVPVHHGDCKQYYKKLIAKIIKTKIL